jgi:hypothetical protein
LPLQEESTFFFNYKKFRGPGTGWAKNKKNLKTWWPTNKMR